MDEQQAQRRAVRPMSCARCRSMHLACDGERPCDRCKRGPHECVNAPPAQRQRRARTVSGGTAPGIAVPIIVVVQSGEATATVVEQLQAALGQQCLVLKPSPNGGMGVHHQSTIAQLGNNNNRSSSASSTVAWDALFAGTGATGASATHSADQLFQLVDPPAVDALAQPGASAPASATGVLSCGPGSGQDNLLILPTRLDLTRIDSWSSSATRSDSDYADSPMTPTGFGWPDEQEDDVDAALACVDGESQLHSVLRELNSACDGVSPGQFYQWPPMLSTTASTTTPESIPVTDAVYGKPPHKRLKRTLNDAQPQMPM